MRVGNAAHNYIFRQSAFTQIKPIQWYTNGDLGQVERKEEGRRGERDKERKRETDRERKRERVRQRERERERTRLNESVTPFHLDGETDRWADRGSGKTEKYREMD